MRLGYNLAMLDRLSDILKRLFIGIVILFLLAGSAPLPVPKLDQVYRYTNEIEFNFIAWMADASWLKLQQAALGSPHYMDRATRKKAVMDYLRQTEEVMQLEYAIDQLYANPDVEDPEGASADLQARLETLYAAQRDLAPFAESVLEAQVSAALAEANLTTGGQPLPQPLYHISPLPMALIISPRETIRQERNISLLADFPVDEQDALE